MNIPLEKNFSVYKTYWSARRQRALSYSNLTKVRRFRKWIKEGGLCNGEGSWVVDIGFGLGSMLFSFPRTFGIAGMELSEDAVRDGTDDAAKRGYKNVDLRVYREGEPYPSEWYRKFDLGISSHVLEHLENPELALCGLKELVKPGGLLFIAVPINENLGDDANHFQVFTQRSLGCLVRKVGLEILRIEECDRLWSTVRRIAWRRQREGRRIDHFITILFNLVTLPMGSDVLKVLDKLLKLGKFPCTQLFVVARVPNPNDSAFAKGEAQVME